MAIFQNTFANSESDTAMVEVKGGVLPDDSELKGAMVKIFLIGKFPVL
jgi:hypothetical protein